MVFVRVSVRIKTRLNVRAIVGLVIGIHFKTSVGLKMGVDRIFRIRIRFQFGIFSPKKRPKLVPPSRSKECVFSECANTPTSSSLPKTSQDQTLFLGILRKPRDDGLFLCTAHKCAGRAGF